MRFKMFTLLVLVLAFSSGCCLFRRDEAVPCYDSVPCQTSCPPVCSP
jgi:hypothetical protein